jgi:hypothetical protein
MIDVVRRIEASDQQNEPSVCSTGRGGGLRPVRERLTVADLAELVASHRSGTRLQELALRYEISMSSVKRILRRARR